MAAHKSHHGHHGPHAAHHLKKKAHGGGVALHHAEPESHHGHHHEEAHPGHILHDVEAEARAKHKRGGAAHHIDGKKPRKRLDRGHHAKGGSAEAHPFSSAHHAEGHFRHGGKMHHASHGRSHHSG